MKLKVWHFSFFILSALTFIFLFPPLVFGLNTTATGYKLLANTLNQTIEGVCFNNTTNDAYFIPTKNANEFNGFQSNRPTATIGSIGFCSANPCVSYTYSPWGACQSNNTQTRTELDRTPAGCTGTPVLSQACTYIGSCTYTYTAWGTCQSNGTQTRTVVTALPSGCAGTPVLSQSCTYVPPSCTSFTYSDWGACQSNSTQTRVELSRTPSGCTGTPVLSQSCTYVPGTCTYTYTGWGVCQSNNTQTRTVVTALPSGCTGTPILTQSCVYVPPSCSSFTYSSWGVCQSNSTQTRTELSRTPAGCTGTPVLSQYCPYCVGCDTPDDCQAGGGCSGGNCIAVTNIPSGSDPEGDCTAVYNSCSGTYRVGPDGYCDGSGDCNSDGLSSDCGGDYWSSSYQCSDTQPQRLYHSSGCSGGSCYDTTSWQSWGSDCGDDYWSSSYQCSGTQPQRLYHSSGCSGGSCYDNTSWINYGGSCATAGTCQTGGGCSSGSCVAIVNVPAGNDPDGDCNTGSYYCNGSLSIASDGNCNGSGACNTGGTSIDCGTSGWTSNYRCSGTQPQREYANRGCNSSTGQCNSVTYSWENYGSSCTTAGTCQTGGGCSGGSCVAVSNVPAGNDPNGNCAAGASPYCSGSTSIASDGYCDGSGACNTGGASLECGASDWTSNYQCSGTQPQREYASRGCNSSNGLCNSVTYSWGNWGSSCATAGTCQTGGGCSGGSCVAVSNVPAGNDPNGNCTASYNSCSGNNKIGPDGNCNGSGACNSTGLSVYCGDSSYNRFCDGGMGSNFLWVYLTTHSCTAGVCNANNQLESGGYCPDTCSNGACVVVCSYHNNYSDTCESLGCYYHYYGSICSDFSCDYYWDYSSCSNAGCLWGGSSCGDVIY